MHYGFFGLSKPPFEPSVATASLFEGGDRQEIMESLIFAIDKGRGVALVGEKGLGKSLTIQCLKTRLEGKIATYHLKSNLQQSFDSPLQIVTETKSAYDGSDPTIKSILETILHKGFVHSELAKVLLIIEEAQNLTMEAWTSICHSIDAARISKPQSVILLVGTPSMTNFKNWDSKNSPIDYKFTLSPLRKSDSILYVKNRIKTAGGNMKDIFSAKALQKISELAEGYPQHINKICKTAMINAFQDKNKKVLTSHIELNPEFSVAKPPYRYTKIQGSLVSLDHNSYLATSMVALVFVGMAVYAIASKIQHDFQSIQLHNSIVQLDQVADSVSKNKIVDTDKSNAGLAQLEIDVKEATVIEIEPQADEKLVLNKNLLDSRLEATLKLLKTTNDSQFSVQLLGGENPQVLRQQIIEIASDIKISDIFAFRTLAQGRPYISIIYGRFDTLNEAQLAIDKLPNHLKANRPYLRTAKGIKEEIRANADYLRNYTD